MALKQRKQITGTTEQINQYAGVEGQLVWDKSAKTLVGMSGTAGKNYPLAPKAFVTNEVAKVNAEATKKADKTYVDQELAKKQPTGDYATNTQLTQGLAGKEDKGVCLPLTGGTLTGNLIANPKNGEFAIELSEHSQALGARIGLNSADREGFEGQLILQATNRTRTVAAVLNPEIDELILNGSPVASFNRLDGYSVRFRNGLQILMGNVQFTPGAGARYNFILPFISPVHVTACIIGGGGTYPPFSIDEVDVTGFRARSPSSWYGNFIAIGRWK